MEIITKNAQETFAFGQKIGNLLLERKGKGRRVYLYGDLGSGKTTFVKGFAQSLKIKKPVLSPTFIIVRQYEISVNGYHDFFHIDLYRLSQKTQMASLGLADIFANDSAVVAVEWADRLKSQLPKEAMEIHFEFIDSNIRKISVKTNG